jgi:hypothetical protein
VKLKWLLIGAVIVLYAGFRVWGLTASCIWFDEIFSVHAAQHSWSTLFDFVAQDLIHPPLFYILLKIWIMAGGDSLLWLRLFPVAMSCAAVAPLILLSRELKLSTFEAALVLLLLGVNGSLIKYAQEIRMYSLLFCLTCFSLWLFVRWFNRAGSPILALFFVNLILIYTHYFGGLIVLAEVAVVLWLRREDARKWLIASVLWLVGFTPWVCAVFTAYRENAGLAQNLNWAKRPGLLELIQFFVALHQPFYYQRMNGEAMASIFVLPVILVCIAALVFLFVKFDGDKNLLKVLVAVCVLPLAIAFVVSWVTPFSIWGNRHLTVIFVPYFLLAAMGLRQISPSIARSLCCAVLIGAFIPAGIATYTRGDIVYPWCSWQPLAAQVQDSDATTFYVFEDAVAYELWYALEQRGAGRYRVVLIEDDAEVWEDKAYFLPRGFPEIEKTNEDAIGGDKFWIVVRDISGKKSMGQYQLWKKLQAEGYRIGEPLSFKTELATAYFVPVEKGK